MAPEEALEEILQVTLKVYVANCMLTYYCRNGTMVVKELSHQERESVMQSLYA